MHAHEGGDHRAERRLCRKLRHRDRAALDKTGHDAAGLLVDRHDLWRHPDGGCSPVGGDFGRPVYAEEFSVVAGHPDNDLSAAQVDLEVGVGDPPGQRLDLGLWPGSTRPTTSLMKSPICRNYQA